MTNHLLSLLLSWKRPSNSKAEAKFIEMFILPLLEFYEGWVDGGGNIIVKVDDNPVMWCCHTDTVHFSGGPQNLVVKQGKVYATGKADCLGADDTTGIYLMIKMIFAGVGGTYVFHRSEEVGCIGSKWIAKNSAEWLSTFKFAIALDRRGTNSVVTHQLGMRCASDAFVKSLIGALNIPGLRPDDTGVYTDTNSYTRIIPECTNLSVGYYNQHTSNEYQDLDYLEILEDALINIDVTKFVCSRDPSVTENMSYRSYSSYPSYTPSPVATGVTTTPPPLHGDPYEGYYDDEEEPVDFEEEVDQYSLQEVKKRVLISLLKNYPEAIISLLDDYNLETTDFVEAVFSYTGALPSEYHSDDFLLLEHLEDIARRGNQKAA